MLARICSLHLLPNLKLCGEETTSNYSSKREPRQGDRIWLSLVPSRVPEKRGYYFAMEISYAVLQAQKIIKRALMTGKTRNSCKSCVFLKKLLFFLSMTIFRDHVNANYQVKLQICDCLALHFPPLKLQLKFCYTLTKTCGASQSGKLLLFSLAPPSTTDQVAQQVKTHMNVTG